MASSRRTAAWAVIFRELPDAERLSAIQSIEGETSLPAHVTLALQITYNGTHVSDVELDHKKTKVSWDETEVEREELECPEDYGSLWKIAVLLIRHRQGKSSSVSELDTIIRGLECRRKTKPNEGVLWLFGKRDQKSRFLELLKERNRPRSKLCERKLPPGNVQDVSSELDERRRSRSPAGSG